MKKYLHLFFSIILVATNAFVFAQPSNDDCSGAILLDIASSEATAIKVDGDTRNTVDELLSSIPSCSGNFYRDAVWYKLVIPDTMPLYGMSVKIYYGTEPYDFESPGIALYASCDGKPSNQPIYCENAPQGDRMILGQFCPKLSPGTTYYIRVWSNKGSSADWTEGWGTFRIAAFLNNPAPTDPQIIWSKGVFNYGLDGWTTMGVSCSDDLNGNEVDGANALWKWGYNSFCALWLGAWLESPTECNGAAYFDSGEYDSYGFIDSAGLGPCPAVHEGLLISPIIDLTGVSVAGISVSFFQISKQFQNQYFLEYRLNDSPDWLVIDLAPGIVAFDPNMPSPFDPVITGEMVIDLPGAELADSIQIRFRFIGTYYYWAIDDVRLIVPEYNSNTMEEEEQQLFEFTSSMATNEVLLTFLGREYGHTISLVIFSMDGRIAYHSTIHPNPGEVVSIPIDFLTSGMYGLSIMSNFRIQTDKIMVYR